MLGREDLGEDEIGSRAGAGEGSEGVEARGRPGRPFSGITSGSGDADDVTIGAGGSSAGSAASGAAITGGALIAIVGDSSGAGAGAGAITGGSS